MKLAQAISKKIISEYINYYTKQKKLLIQVLKLMKNKQIYFINQDFNYLKKIVSC